jgi:hypothetical protein
MIDISEGLAKTIHHWSNVVLVAAALVVGVATLISVWTEGLLNRATDSRIAQNKRDSEQLKEKQRPRVILDEQKTAFLKRLRVLLGEEFCCHTNSKMMTHAYSHCRFVIYWKPLDMNQTQQTTLLGSKVMNRGLALVLGSLA